MPASSTDLDLSGGASRSLLALIDHEVEQVVPVELHDLKAGVGFASHVANVLRHALEGLVGVGDDEHV
jgi:hypothetical protein